MFITVTIIRNPIGQVNKIVFKSSTTPYANPCRLGSKTVYKSFCVENGEKIQAELIFSRFSRPVFFFVEVSRKSSEDI
jgi:hypothetical protein